jgi:exopolysaccharide biosynthesis predicted pyruvyltransferase EpsI
MRTNEAVISTQTNRLKEVISKLMPPGTKYALLDFPDYPNVGDSAIWLGETKLLSQLSGNWPSYVCHLGYFDSDRLEQALPAGPILLNGGGNFGDIWPWIQNFREQIIERYKNRTIIQLPQTISFGNKLAIERCAKIIAQHPNFHLLVRDQPSLEFAKQHFQCSVELVPDMAFGIGALKRPISPIHNILMLLREDAERASYDRSPLQTLLNASIADWLEEPQKFDKTSKYTAAFKALFNGSWGRDERRFVYYQQLANGRLNRGLKLLSSGRHVITDRLHGHILSTLLDIPHVALDNNYGKILSYIEAWTHTYPALQTAKTAEEALEKLALLPNDQAK